MSQLGIRLGDVRLVRLAGNVEHTEVELLYYTDIVYSIGVGVRLMTQIIDDSYSIYSHIKTIKIPLTKKELVILELLTNSGGVMSVDSALITVKSIELYASAIDNVPKLS